MKKVRRSGNLRRAMSSVEQTNSRRYERSASISYKAERSVSLSTTSGAGEFNHLIRLVLTIIVEPLTRSTSCDTEILQISP